MASKSSKQTRLPSSPESNPTTIRPPLPPSPLNTSPGRYIYYSRDDLDSLGSGDYPNYTVHLPPTPDNQSVDSNSGTAAGKVVESESTCSVPGCSARVMTDERGAEVLPCECDFKICKDCYVDVVNDDGVCPGCKDAYGSNTASADLDQQGRNLQSPPAFGRSMSHTNGRLSMVKSTKSVLMRSQTAGSLFETKGTYGYRNAIWPTDGEVNGGLTDKNDDGVNETGDLANKLWKPLTRELSIPAAVLAPYRISKPGGCFSAGRVNMVSILCTFIVKFPPSPVIHLLLLVSVLPLNSGIFAWLILLLRRYLISFPIKVFQCKALRLLLCVIHVL